MSLPDQIKHLNNVITKLQQEIYNTKENLKENYIRKSQFKKLSQSEQQMGIVTALVVDTIDIWKQNRIRFFCPLFHDPDRPIKSLPWASPCSALGGFDDCGVTWIPPAGSTVCIAFEGGQRNSPYYIGTTWGRDRGPAGNHVWGINIDEYQRVSEGHRIGYLCGPDDESQVLPPWNTENYNGFDLNSNVDFDDNPEAQKRITYPNIMGFKTPEKHMFKMVDGDPKCDRKWKRIEIMSGCGNWLIMKDDHLHYSGQWAHPSCGVCPGDVSCPVGTSDPNPAEDITKVVGLSTNALGAALGGAVVPTVTSAFSTGAQPQLVPPKELTTCEGDRSNSNIIGGHPDTPVNRIYTPTPYQGLNGECQQVGANPFFKQESECRPYRGPGTPQNNKAALPQSGIQLLSISGNSFVMDDSVQEPQGIPEWERSMLDFDFGCNNVYMGKIELKSATGHAITMSDIEVADTPELRGQDNYIRLLTACGTMIELNDHTTGGSNCPGCPPNLAGEKRGITMRTTSNHTFEMLDQGNKQCAPCRMEGGVPVPKADNAFIRLRSGYGLIIEMHDDHDQETTQGQYIQIFCPQTTNTERGPHIMRFQEVPSGPGQIFLRSGGDYIIQTYDFMVEEVGDPDKNPSDKMEFISRNKFVDVKENYINSAKLHLFVADDFIFLLAGKDCAEQDGSLGPCPAPVLVYANGCVTISDRVYATASQGAPAASIFMMDPFCSMGKATAAGGA